MANFALTIEGQQVQAAPGTTVLQAALGAGIDIPHLCYHPRLQPSSSCRLCLVEIEGARGLVASCSCPASAGMVVRTRSERLDRARRLALELLLSDHPLDCMTCEQAGDCALQDYAYAFGLKGSRFAGEQHHYPVDSSNPFIVRDYDKCILCERCVSVCRDVQVSDAIGLAGRGFETKVAVQYDRPLQEGSCVFCGQCVSVCPTGALVEKQRLGRGRLWEMEKVRTVCPFCGCGCNIDLNVREGRIAYVSSVPDAPVGGGSLCVKGRFGWDFVHSPDRLTHPLVKENGAFRRATWEEALEVVARRLAQIKAESGPDSLAALSSAKCTNEENYLLQKLVRAALGTNNVDHCARLCHASTVAGLATAFGSGAMTNSIAEIEGADVILVIGSNTTENHPIVGLAVKRAVRRGTARLIVADPRRIELTRCAELHLRQACGTDVALLNGLMHVILAEGLHDQRFVEARTEGFAEFRASLARYTPEYVEGVTGVPADDVRRAGRLYATAEKASILYSMGITQHTCGTDNVLAVANLAMLTGNLGRQSAGVNPLRGQNNVQGACDMGALPNLYPGYQRVGDAQVRARFAAAWGVPLPEAAGLTVVEMMRAAAEGRVRGMYLMGENPMMSDPDVNHIREALERLEFLVVQDIFLTETAELADVVLPAASFAEKDGTVTNTERRVQRMRQAIEPVGEARQDWQILCDVAGRLGYPMDYESPARIMEEIAALTPSYGGIRYDRLDGEGLHWPCPDAHHPGTKILHRDRFTRGLGRFHVVHHAAPAEVPDAEYPLVLTTGRILYHYHTIMTRKAAGLNALRPEATVEVNPVDALRLGVRADGMVRVTSRRGSIVARAEVTQAPPVGTVFTTFHFREAAANLLTNQALDPVAKIPEYKACAVKVEPVSPVDGAGAG
ncbi:MAG: formate dehydrogenase subunit alpha [Candidatus Latescibacterota bacterium]